MDAAQTRYGQLKIKNISESEKGIFLSSKALFKREHGYLDIEKIFQINDNDVALIRDSEGGSGTIDSFFFVTLTRGLSPIVSEGFWAQKNEISPLQKGTQIVVDLGYKESVHEILTYQDGKISIQKTTAKGKKKQASDDDCNYLYRRSQKDS